MVAAWAVLQWLLSPAGRIFAFIGFALIVILTAFAKGRSSGRQIERQRARVARERAAGQAARTREQAAATPADKQREELSKWER